MNDKKLTQERRDHITRLLIDDGAVRVSELAQKFGVSAETIRKDLIFLESKGIAKKEYGGAVVANELIELNFMQKSIKNVQKKKDIASQAEKMIVPGSVIFLDSGSTVYCLAKLIINRDDITVFTNCLNVAMLFSNSKTKAYIIGGEIKRSSKAVIGMWGVEALNTIKVDIAFLGTSGFYKRGGPCVESFGEAYIKKHIINCCKKALVLADSSKSYQDALVKYADWEQIHALITDSNIEPTIINQIKKQTRLILV